MTNMRMRISRMWKIRRRKRKKRNMRMRSRRIKRERV